MKNNTGAAVAGAVMGLAILCGGSGAHAQTMASLPANAPAAAVTGDARGVRLGRFLPTPPAGMRRQPRRGAGDHADAADLAHIIATNRKVNVGIQAVTDMEHWGVPDRWDLPDDGYGDCEDFQLLKRKLLAEAGLPRRAMRVTVVIDEKGEGHAVLMVRTDRGDFVLDNKTSAVLPWHQTGYVYVKREGQAGLGWVSLGGATSPVVTANR
jgi:predicted transglutaminase-like cysteine proteinase